MRKLRLGAHGTVQGRSSSLCAQRSPKGQPRAPPWGICRRSLPITLALPILNNSTPIFLGITGVLAGQMLNPKFCSLWFLLSPLSPHFCDSFIPSWKLSLGSAQAHNPSDSALRWHPRGSPREDKAAGKEKNMDS